MYYADPWSFLQKKNKKKKKRQTMNLYKWVHKYE